MPKEQSLEFERVAIGHSPDPYFRNANGARQYASPFIKKAGSFANRQSDDNLPKIPHGSIGPASRMPVGSLQAKFQQSGIASRT